MRRGCGETGRGVAKGGDIDYPIQAGGCSMRALLAPPRLISCLHASTSSEVVESPRRPTPFLPCIFATPHTGMRAEMGSRLLPPFFVHALQGPFLVPAALLYPRA